MFNSRWRIRFVQELSESIKSLWNLHKSHFLLLISVPRFNRNFAASSHRCQDGFWGNRCKYHTGTIFLRNFSKFSILHVFRCHKRVVWLPACFVSLVIYFRMLYVWARAPRHSTQHSPPKHHQPNQPTNHMKDQSSLTNMTQSSPLNNLWTNHTTKNPNPKTQFLGSFSFFISSGREKSPWGVEWILLLLYWYCRFCFAWYRII